MSLLWPIVAIGASPACAQAGQFDPICGPSSRMIFLWFFWNQMLASTNNDFYVIMSSLPATSLRSKHQQGYDAIIASSRWALLGTQHSTEDEVSILLCECSQTMASFLDYWGSSLDSGSEDERDYSSLLHDDIIAWEEVNQDDPWTHLSHSTQGASIILGCWIGLKQGDSNGHTILQPTDEMLFEIRSRSDGIIRCQARAIWTLITTYLTMLDWCLQLLSYSYSPFSSILTIYISEGITSNGGAQPMWSFCDIGSFLYCEVIMRLYNASETDLPLPDFEVQDDKFTEYNGYVMHWLRLIDQPLSVQQQMMGQS